MEAIEVPMIPFLCQAIFSEEMIASSPDMQSAAKTFFSARKFAVAGASSQTHKFGHRIFAWYLHHSLPAVPLNPTCSAVTVRGKEYETVQSPSQLSEPESTGLSIITPPPVTDKILKEAKKSGVKAVWLQPGSFTDEQLEWATKEFPGAAVGGYGGGTRGGEGWCVLVDGEAAMKASGRQEKL